MGNRAVVTWADENGKTSPESVGVYLHWNGGRDSIEAFLAYCDICGFRDPSQDDYGLARFTQVVANFFGGDGLSVGVNTLGRLDTNNGDNGTYVCKGWEIVGREHAPGSEQREYDLREMVADINSRQCPGLRKSDEELAKLLDEYEARRAAKSAETSAPFA